MAIPRPAGPGVRAPEPRGRAFPTSRVIASSIEQRGSGSPTGAFNQHVLPERHRAVRTADRSSSRPPPARAEGRRPAHDQRADDAIAWCSMLPYPMADSKRNGVSAAHPSECEVEANAEAAAGETYGWYLWKQSLRAGANRLRVRYLQRWFVQNGRGTTADRARLGQRADRQKLHIELRDPDARSVSPGTRRTSRRPVGSVEDARKTRWRARFILR